MKTKETTPGFIISDEWKQKLIDNPQMLDLYLTNAEKMRDDVIDRTAKLTERGYKFIEFMLLIATILSAIGINTASGLAKIVLAAILVCFLIVCVLSFFLLRSNKIFYKGYEIGEVTCPTKYFDDASSINLRRSTIYGLGCLRVSLVYRLCKWHLMKSRLFA